MITKKALILVFCVCYYILTPTNAWALKCKNFSTSEAFHNSSGVFTGKVLAIEELANKSKKNVIQLKHIVTFFVHRTWKGNFPKITKVATEEIYDMWQNPFKVGNTYFVFVNSNKDYAEYVFPICGVKKSFPDNALISELDGLIAKGE